MSFLYVTVCVGHPVRNIKNKEKNKGVLTTDYFKKKSKKKHIQFDLGFSPPL